MTPFNFYRHAFIEFCEKVMNFFPSNLVHYLLTNCWNTARTFQSGVWWYLLFIFLNQIFRILGTFLSIEFSQVLWFSKWFPNQSISGRSNQGLNDWKLIKANSTIEDTHVYDIVLGWDNSSRKSIKQCQIM